MRKELKMCKDLTYEELGKWCKTLVEEKNELKKQLAIACHVKYGDADAFDWAILHRIWDLEDSLERIIGMCTNDEFPDGITTQYSGFGIPAVVHCARKSLERSRT